MFANNIVAMFFLIRTKPVTTQPPSEEQIF